MNSNVLGAINGVAVAAKNAGDHATIALCQRMLSDAEDIPLNYDGAAVNTTTLALKYPQRRAVSVNTSFDSITGLGSPRDLGA